MVKKTDIEYVVSIQTASSYFDGHMQEILTTADRAKDFCSKKGISVNVNGFYAYWEGQALKAYRNHVKIYENDMSEGFSPVAFTENIMGKLDSKTGSEDHEKTEDKMQEQKERALLKMLLTGFYFAYKAESGAFNGSGKGMFFSRYIPDKAVSLDRFSCGQADFVIKDDREAYYILCNNEEKWMYSFKKTGKLSLAKYVHILTDKNTKDLEDKEEAASIFAEFIRMTGVFDCTKKINSRVNLLQVIYTALVESGYCKKHQVVPCVGYVLHTLTQKAHKCAVLLVDGVSVINPYQRKYSDLQRIFWEAAYGKPESGRSSADIEKQKEESIPYKEFMQSYFSYHDAGKAVGLCYVLTEEKGLVAKYVCEKRR